jgi:hypothetical protein
MNHYFSMFLLGFSIGLNAVSCYYNYKLKNYAWFVISGSMFIFLITIIFKGLYK